MESRKKNDSRDQLSEIQKKLSNPESFLDGVAAFDRFVADPKNSSFIEKNIGDIRTVNTEIIVKISETLTTEAFNAFRTLDISDADSRENNAKTFNQISEYVRSDILSRNNIEERNFAVERWIRIANQLTNQGDFFSAQAIFQSFTFSDVSRLYQDAKGKMGGLSKDVLSQFEVLNNLYAGTDESNKNLQKLIGDFKGPVVANIDRITKNISLMQEGTIVNLYIDIERLEEQIESLIAESKDRATKEDKGKDKDIQAEILKLNAEIAEKKKMIEENKKAYSEVNKQALKTIYKPRDKSGSSIQIDVLHKAVFGNDSVNKYLEDKKTQRMLEVKITKLDGAYNALMDQYEEINDREVKSEAEIAKKSSDLRDVDAKMEEIKKQKAKLVSDKNALESSNIKFEDQFTVQSQRYRSKGEPIGKSKIIKIKHLTEPVEEKISSLKQKAASEAKAPLPKGYSDAIDKLAAVIKTIPNAGILVQALRDRPSTKGNPDDRIQNWIIIESFLKSSDDKIKGLIVEILDIESPESAKKKMYAASDSPSSSVSSPQLQAAAPSASPPPRPSQPLPSTTPTASSPESSPRTPAPEAPQIRRSPTPPTGWSQRAPSRMTAPKATPESSPRASDGSATKKAPQEYYNAIDALEAKIEKRKDASDLIAALRNHPELQGTAKMSNSINITKLMKKFSDVALEVQEITKLEKTSPTSSPRSAAPPLSPPPEPTLPPAAPEVTQSSLAPEDAALPPPLKLDDDSGDEVHSNPSPPESPSSSPRSDAHQPSASALQPSSPQIAPQAEQVAPQPVVVPGVKQPRGAPTTTTSKLVKRERYIDDTEVNLRARQLYSQIEKDINRCIALKSVIPKTHEGKDSRDFRTVDDAVKSLIMLKSELESAIKGDKSSLSKNLTSVNKKYNDDKDIQETRNDIDNKYQYQQQATVTVKKSY